MEGRGHVEEGTFESIKKRSGELHDALNKILATKMVDLPSKKRAELFVLIDNGLKSILDKLKEEGI